MFGEPLRQHKAVTVRDDPVRRLRAQLPEAAFPATARTLPTVLLVLFLGLAGTTFLLLDDREGHEVPAAFVDAQREVASSTAKSVGATASQRVTDLRMAALDRSEPGPLLDALARDRKWRGAAVLAGPARSLVAAKGEAVPAQAVPADATDATVTSTVAANGEPVLVVGAPLPDGRLLVATTAVRLPDAAQDETLRQAFVLTTLSGKVLASSGAQWWNADPKTAALVSDAGRAAAGTPGVLLGTPTGERQPTLGYARVTPPSAPGGLDLAVVAAAEGPLAHRGAAGSGLLPAVALAVLAVIGYVVVTRAVTRPVLAARADLLRLAAGDLDTDIRPARTGEAARIVAAAQLCQDRLTGGEGNTEPVAGRRFTARVAAGLVAATVFAWSGYVLVAYRTKDVDIPPVLVGTARVQTDKATDALRRSLNNGLSDLEALAAQAKDPATLRSAFERLMVGQTRYRSLYLVDRGGAPGDPVGRPPLRTTAPPATGAGLHQQDQSGRVPVIFAEVPLAERGGALVGEFDLDHLRSLLDQVPGHARVVDRDLRTVHATDGFVAFEEVTKKDVRDTVELARDGQVVGTIRAGRDGPVILASAAVRGGAAGRLGWTVVTEQPGSELALPENLVRKNAQLVALVAALIALFGYGWLLFTVLGPLRRIARAADRLVAGDFDAVIYPQRHDEIGTIASCLEICRQAVTQGPGRLGEVRRPRGAATDPTQLLKPVVQPDRRPARATRPPRRRGPEPTRAGRA
ncbi:HAMP domain-containing protein [Saccharothrix sp.]|uniref:HAMP domain-containing protein n=1 Tax=Saccharothrix sp. TaxID=1873460 RepID=UPI0028128285|nr:HAMP domain-containing protein [Saccharothrix sp.]